MLDVKVCCAVVIERAQNKSVGAFLHTLITPQFK